VPNEAARCSCSPPADSIGVKLASRSPAGRPFGPDIEDVRIRPQGFDLLAGGGDEVADEGSIARETWVR